MAQRVPTAEELALHLAKKRGEDVPDNGVIDPSGLVLKSIPEMRFAVASVLRAADIDPVQELVDHYKERYPNDHPDPEKRGTFVLSRSERISMMKELMQYVSPKLKATEIHKTVDKRVIVVLRSQSGETLSAKEFEPRGTALEINE